MIPGQGERPVQARVSSVSAAPPAQVPVQVLLLDSDPEPQVAEQSPHWVHSPNTSKRRN